MVLPVVSTAAAATPMPLASPAPIAPADRVQMFEDALQRQGAAAPVAAQPPVAAAGQADGTGALDRARQGFALDGAPAVAAPVGGGDMILEGMQKMRGIFDRSETRVGDIMSKGGTDAGSLMQMQLELTNFTLLVDLSSKLTGKTTQVFDTLMKGQ